MKVSILMPVYNEITTIMDVIELVRNVKVEKEIIIVDDGSLDNTVKIIKQYIQKIGAQRSKSIKLIEKKKNQDYWENQFYTVMEGFKYVPGGRILAGAGGGFSITYYNCFVLPSPKDSRGGILESLGQMVEIMARGGGVGINLSSLRQRGARVRKVNGFSSGPCNWGRAFFLLPQRNYPARRNKKRRTNAYA